MLLFYLQPVTIATGRYRAAAAADADVKSWARWLHAVGMMSVFVWQEVDYEHYTTRLQSSMKQLGYEGILLQRRDEQGLATFWKTSKFQLVAQKQATLHHLAEKHIEVCLARCKCVFSNIIISCHCVEYVGAVWHASTVSLLYDRYTVGLSVNTRRVQLSQQLSFIHRQTLRCLVN